MIEAGRDRSVTHRWLRRWQALIEVGEIDPRRGAFNIPELLNTLMRPSTARPVVSEYSKPAKAVNPPPEPPPRLRCYHLGLVALAGWKADLLRMVGGDVKIVAAGFGETRNGRKAAPDTPSNPSSA
jgi:hypothetical protein